jgi:Trk-type K+ transport system membrane component
MWGIIYWPVFLSVVSALFLIPELIALFTNAANTLSVYAWRELNITMISGHGPHTLAWWLSLISWLLFTVIITAHIWWHALS